MNKLSYILQIIAVFLLVSTECFSQNLDKAQLKVIPKEVEQRGDELYVNMDIDVSRLVIDPDRSLTLTPVLVAPKGEKELPELIINGKRRHKAYERELSVMSKKRLSQMPTPYNVFKAKKKSEGVLNYTLSIPFEEWMKEARLDLKEDLCGCAGESQEVTVERLVNRVLVEYVLPYDVQPLAAYIRPEVEEIKNRSESVDVFLDFPVSKTVILPEFGNNPRELPKIESAIRDIHADKNVQVSLVDIRGYASPEGSVALNDRLSEGRADALRRYLANRAGFPPQLYRVSHGGEDWDGLTKMLEESYWTGKDQVLYIIRNTPSAEERKNKIKAIDGAVTWNRLINEFFPPLRRVVCQMNYTVRGFSVEEGKEVFKTRPQQLSLEEMFHVANTYPMGSNEFVEVFETAVRLFPEDKVANLNAAAAALMLGNTDRAEKYLGLADKTTPEYVNNLGILHLLRDDYEEARRLFNEADMRGISAAKHNLEELEKKLDTSSRVERR